MIPTFDEVMRLTRTISGELALTDADATGLYQSLAQVPQNGVVVEIGCELGRSSSLILQMAKAIGFRSIHIDAYEQHADYLARWSERMHNIDYPFTFYRSRSTDWWTNQTVKAAAPEGFDLVYVDADHGYTPATLDCQMYASHVRQGGFLCAHDYGQPSCPDVRPALDQFTKDGWELVSATGYLGAWRRL